jgi:hypothetical protein
MISDRCLLAFTGLFFYFVSKILIMALSSTFLLLSIFGSQETILFTMILFASALSYFTYKYGKNQGRTEEIQKMMKEAEAYSKEKIF